MAISITAEAVARGKEQASLPGKFSSLWRTTLAYAAQLGCGKGSSSTAAINIAAPLSSFSRSTYSSYTLESKTIIFFGVYTHSQRFSTFNSQLFIFITTPDESTNTHTPQQCVPPSSLRHSWPQPSPQIPQARVTRYVSTLVEAHV